MSMIDFSMAQSREEHPCYVDDQWVDEIWKKFDGRVTRAQVYAVAREVERGFEDATVTTFLPFFIHRLTCERLTAEINGNG